MIKKYYFDLNSNYIIEPNVSCIGYFDGVHLGHQRLIDETIKLAKKLNVKPYLITFDPDPKEVVNNINTSKINSLHSRIKLFEKYGIKGVIIIHFDLDLMKMNTNDFYIKYLSKFNLKGIVCGKDFRYAYNQKGSYKTLKKNIKNTIVIDEVRYYNKKISSTRILNEIKKGNFNLVNKMLGYKYER